MLIICAVLIGVPIIISIQINKIRRKSSEYVSLSRKHYIFHHCSENAQYNCVHNTYLEQKTSNILKLSTQVLRTHSQCHDYIFFFTIILSPSSFWKVSLELYLKYSLMISCRKDQLRRALLGARASYYVLERFRHEKRFARAEITWISEVRILFLSLR